MQLHAVLIASLVLATIALAVDHMRMAKRLKTFETTLCARRGQCNKEGWNDNDFENFHVNWLDCSMYMKEKAKNVDMSRYIDSIISMNGVNEIEQPHHEEDCEQYWENMTAKSARMHTVSKSVTGEDIA